MAYFGIDLGTTNSLIARYANGTVTIFKNPIGLKDTLPSVVGFRSGRLLIGDKAREFLDKDPHNVVGAFKRRMGTTDTYWFDGIGQTKTPIELSALVLQELKTFVQTGESVQSAVITIPASFDTVQANATRQAGLMAGLREVVLLQEPVAASLAFANQTGQNERFANRQWLVYDLGGGTFDVALAKTENGEMTIVDHEGDNFLGGVDFDSGLIDLFVIPYLENLTNGQISDQDLKSQQGAYNALYYQLLKRAEEAKIALSAQLETDIEFEFTAPDGVYHDVVLPIERAHFEASIRPAIQRTVTMIEAIMSRNKLAVSDIDCILMVGGSTYVPCVRQLVSEALGIPISTEIDPTNAIAVGAAHYAGTRMAVPETVAVSDEVAPEVSQYQVKAAYQKVSQDTLEIFMADVEGPVQGVSYRIVRTDGGYDSGLKPVTGRISEELPLMPNATNTFELRLYNARQTLVHTVPAIRIQSGRYGILGQPLPHDICLELDDPEAETTRLEVVFEKNAVLPMRRVLTRTLSKTIRRGSDERVVINVLEGPRTVSPYVNLSIGSIEIGGSQLPVDLIKGSDVEIILEMTESRELRITAFLVMTEQEFSAQFSPTARHLSVTKLIDDLRAMTNQADSELRYTTGTGDVTEYRYLGDLQQEAYDLLRQAQNLAHDDVTDRKYQIDDRKRQLARQFDGLTRDNHLLRLKESYYEHKNECRELLESHGAPGEKTQFNEIVNEESRLMRSQDTFHLKNAIDQFASLLGVLRARSPEFVESFFFNLSHLNLAYRDPVKAQQLIAKGNEHLQKQRWSHLVQVINQLTAMLPNDRQLDNPLNGTGLR